MALVRYMDGSILIDDVSKLYEKKTLKNIVFTMCIYSGLKKQTTVYFCCIESQNRALLGKSMIHGETEEKSPYI